MKQTLSREHRKILETTVREARAAAEAGAEKALKALAVAAKDAPAHATAAQKKLRVRLRAHGRALGDPLRADDSQDTSQLVAEIAYEHWHRMLFARFLAENDLLAHPDGYPISLADCKEDIEQFDPPARSEWEVAGHYAARMLPNVFRPDSPTLAIQLPLETEQALEALLAKLPATVFQADDSLGWSYQFWQAPKKEEVQRQMKQAGTKVGVEELPAVTQLFTEPYMVAFLLENALGGWWLGRYPDRPLPVDMPYLRLLPSPASGRGAGGEGGQPAAGTFPAWPDTLAQFKLLDPCAGSGHFLVSALHYLVPLRMASEKLPVAEAIDRVLAENLHGLELDARCVEIAAFALALAAWRYPDLDSPLPPGEGPGERAKPLGYRPLPKLNIACVGVAPRSKKADWLKLAGGDERLESGMAALYALFQKAPELGSLIDPMAATRGDLLDAHWQELESRLEQALLPSPASGRGAGGEGANEQDIEARVAAQGMVHASRILTRKYHLVITNPPYLGAGQHGQVLKDFCEEQYSAAKNDLANVFLERSLKLCASGGTSLTKKSYKLYEPYLSGKKQVELTSDDREESLANHYAFNRLNRRSLSTGGTALSILRQALDLAPTPYCDFDFDKYKRVKYEGLLAITVANGMHPNQASMAASLRVTDSDLLSASIRPANRRHPIVGFQTCPVYSVNVANYAKLIQPFQGPDLTEFRSFVTEYLAGTFLEHTDHDYYRIDNREKIKIPNPHDKRVRGHELKSTLLKAGMTHKEFQQERQRTREWSRNCPRTEPKPPLNKAA